MTSRFFPAIRTSMIALAAIGGVLGTTVPAQAQGDLLIAPTRVILDGRRGTEVILSNIGSEEATYRIGLELRRMTEDGGLVTVAREDANEAESAALDMIRYAPRRITLPPGQPQAVRIAARPGADVPDGEYRVHMSFKAIPRAKAVSEEDEQVEGMRIKLIPIYGITIPIIVRHGRLETQVALGQPQLELTDNGGAVSLRIDRNGQASTYGDLHIKRQGSDELLYSARGLAIYSEVSGREFTLPVRPEQLAQLSGPVRVEYREPREKGGTLLASVDTVLN